MLDMKKYCTLEAKGMEKNILPSELEDSLKIFYHQNWKLLNSYLPTVPFSCPICN